MKLWALGKDGSRRELEIQELWPHKGLLVLKFAGVDSISQAEELIGCECQVPAQQRAVLEPGWSYISDLAGCMVFDGEREVGSVLDVQFGAGEAPLLRVQSGSQIFEVPFAEAYLKKLDVAAKRIEMRLPEGMLDINAPLTAEEKKAQRKSGA